MSPHSRLGAALLGAVLALAPLLAAAEPVAGPQAFVSQASRAGLAQIEAAKQALLNSKDSGTSAFAQQIVDDYTRSNIDLKVLAQKKGLRLAEADEAQAQPQVRALQVPVADFDAAYARSQVAAHEQAVALYGEQAERGADADLQSFARNNLPVLKHHLQLARELARAHPAP